MLSVPVPYCTRTRIAPTIQLLSVVYLTIVMLVFMPYSRGSWVFRVCRGGFCQGFIDAV